MPTPHWTSGFRNRIALFAIFLTIAPTDSHADLFSLDQNRPFILTELFENLSFSPTQQNVAVYENSSGTPILSLIETARYSLDIEIYTMNSQTVRDTLRRAMQRGVQVRIVQEPRPVATTCQIFIDPQTNDSPNCLDLKRLIREVRNTPGGRYEPYNKDAFCFGQRGRCFQHGKLMIVDKMVAIISTGNFDDSSLCNEFARERCNRDYTVWIGNPASIRALNQVFERDLLGEEYDLDSMMSKHQNSQITVSPLSLTPIIDFIRSARYSVSVQNQYLKHAEINEALLDQARRGVDVTITVSSPCFFAPPRPADAEAFSTIYRAFDNAGVRSRVFTRSVGINQRDGYLHAKAIVVDERRAWVGSVNGSQSGTCINREFGIFIDDPREVGRLHNWVYSDFHHPGTASWDESLLCRKDQASQQQEIDEIEFAD